VTRTWIYPTKKLGLFPRLFNYFSFVFSSLLLGLWGLGKVDVVLTESPPLFLGISGYLLSRIKKAKWIFNVSDLWPESAVRLGVLNEGLALKLAKWLEGFCYRKAWLVTGQSKSILADIERRFPDVATYHLSNGVDTELFGPENFQQAIRKKLSPDGDLIFFYGGLHGLAQGLDQILRAAQEAPEGVRFVLMGDGPEKEALAPILPVRLLQGARAPEAPQTNAPPTVRPTRLCGIPADLADPPPRLPLGLDRLGGARRHIPPGEPGRIPADRQGGWMA
jgi:glycosyltransferase involved in cell wall biosynthesis